MPPPRIELATSPARRSARRDGSVRGRQSSTTTSLGPGRSTTASRALYAPSIGTTDDGRRCAATRRARSRTRARSRYATPGRRGRWSSRSVRTRSCQNLTHVARGERGDAFGRAFGGHARTDASPNSDAIEDLRGNVRARVRRSASSTIRRARTRATTASEMIGLARSFWSASMAERGSLDVIWNRRVVRRDRRLEPHARAIQHVDPARVVLARDLVEDIGGERGDAGCGAVLAAAGPRHDRGDGDDRQLRALDEREPQAVVERHDLDGWRRERSRDGRRRSRPVDARARPGNVIAVRAWAPRPACHARHHHEREALADHGACSGRPMIVTALVAVSHRRTVAVSSGSPTAPRRSSWMSKRFASPT